MSNTQAPPRTRRFSLGTGLVILAVVACLAYGLKLLALKYTDLNSGNATVLGTTGRTVSPAVQATAVDTVQTFLGALHRQDYDHALKVTAPGFPAPHTVAALKLLAERPSFSVIFAGPLTFERANIDSHGQKLVLRASLQSGGEQYRTVCSLVKDKDAWLVSGVIDPAPPGKRLAVPMKSAKPH